MATMKAMFRHGSNGPETSCDDAKTWHFTFRSEREFREMHGLPIPVDTEDGEREIFGETLDEPIPDEFWEMIS